MKKSKQCPVHRSQDGSWSSCGWVSMKCEPRLLRVLWWCLLAICFGEWGGLGKNDWWVGEGIDLVSIFIWFAWAAAWMSCQGPPTHHIHPSWPPTSSWAAWMNRDVHLYIHPSIPCFLLGAHLLRREGVFFLIRLCVSHPSNIENSTP